MIGRREETAGEATAGDGYINREGEGDDEEGDVGTACRREVDANHCRLAGTRAAAGNWPCPEQPDCPGLACTTLPPLAAALLLLLRRPFRHPVGSGAAPGAAEKCCPVPLRPAKICDTGLPQQVGSFFFTVSPECERYMVR